MTLNIIFSVVLADFITGYKQFLVTVSPFANIKPKEAQVHSIILLV